LLEKLDQSTSFLFQTINTLLRFRKTLHKQRRWLSNEYGAFASLHRSSGIKFVAKATSKAFPFAIVPCPGAIFLPVSRRKCAEEESPKDRFGLFSCLFAR